MVMQAGDTVAQRWKLTERVATGGMGDVYRAHDRRLERQVAIKTLRAEGDVARQRFDAEVAVLAKLQHANIVPLFDAGEHDGVPFLVMAFIDGPTLSEVVADGPLAPERVASIGAELAGALHYAHGAGVVHRDVKPGNVLFDARGVARLADFGIARLADVAGVTATGVAMGTAAYIAPEQLTRDLEVGPRADLYALGLVLLEALTGEREFDGPATEAALARLSRDPHIPETLPSGWQQLLGGLTARRPDQRPTANEVVAALADIDGAPDRTRTLELAADGAGTTTVIEQDTPTVTARGPVGDRGGRWHTGGRRLAPYVAIGVVSFLAAWVLVAGPDAPEEVTGPDGREVELPAELEDALETLHETVQP
ncbi:serine/threonine-protein kinase [Nitriliruptor alkaliphilus]|uniref:serine/threonine-protein kinase n=1 Tax=Nitriliruptor alkaliphilus TaxID=427918 RepID=UPI000697DBD3|nr:serine/threonine-protein kinase [Nitriliruptor alkaliphilus]